MGELTQDLGLSATRVGQQPRSTLVWQANLKFGEETAEDLAALLEGVSDPERIKQVASLIINCATGPALLRQLRN